SDDRISTGDPNYTVRRDKMSSVGVTAQTEGLYAFDARSSVTAGADYSHTSHQLPSYVDVFTPQSSRAGQETPEGLPGGLHVFDNLGVYTQGIAYVLEDTALTVGLRLDNNSVYGNEFTSRAGLVSALLPGLSTKLLYGSSFKAPSPPQLFGQPLTIGDIIGDATLKPETAQTVEAALLYEAGRNLELLSDVYYTHVADRITFVTRGANSDAVQSASDSVGLEAEARWRWRWLHGSINGSLQATASAPEGTATADTLAELPEAFPTYMFNAGVGCPLGPLPLSAYLEGRLVGAVPATQSNFAKNGLVQYELPLSGLLDFTLSSKPWNLGDGSLSASLKLSNLLGGPDVQPGFGGIDYPGAGRTLLLRIDYAW
ncbi:MAG: TonB-dependent receptor, partial [Caulobacter sp.]|nr:TonB-dependent receptor [Vitreoscilla sp.]